MTSIIPPDRCPRLSLREPARFFLQLVGRDPERGTTEWHIHVSGVVSREVVARRVTGQSVPRRHAQEDVLFIGGEDRECQLRFEELQGLVERRPVLRGPPEPLHERSHLPCEEAGIGPAPARLGCPGLDPDAEPGQVAALRGALKELVSEQLEAEPRPDVPGQDHRVSNLSATT